MKYVKTGFVLYNGKEIPTLSTEASYFLLEVMKGLASISTEEQEYFFSSPFGVITFAMNRHARLQNISRQEPSGHAVEG